MSNRINAVLALSIEIVLMRRNASRYHQVLSKLKNYYNCKIFDCFEHPEHLKSVIQEVYPNDHQMIINDLKVELDEVTSQKEIADFLKVLEK